MKIVQYSEPAIEPITLQEIKEHLHLDSGDFAENIDTTQSITPGNQAITTGFDLVGAGVDVLIYETVVNLNSGTNNATGTVDVKIQDSDDDITYTDWYSYTQVTTSNDNQVFEKEYTGGRSYVRVIAKTLLATCDFSVDVVRRNTQAVDDSYLSGLITTAREYTENATWRKLITQSIEVYLDSLPVLIELPFGNLQTVTHIKYLESDGTENTISSDDYIVETNGANKGRIVLAYDASWPDFIPYPSNPIQIRYVCGYGDNTSDVPAVFKHAIKLQVHDWYSNREGQTDKPLSVNKSVDALHAVRRLF